MDPINHLDFDDSTAGIVDRVADVLLGTVALAALVTAFAVEFAPSIRDDGTAAPSLIACNTIGQLER